MRPYLIDNLVDIFYKFRCNYCGKRSNKLDYDGINQPVIHKLKIIGAGRRKCKCIHCGVNDRSRLELFYLRTQTRLLDTNTKYRVLMIAPEYHLYEVLNGRSNLRVDTGDINPKRYEFADTVYSDLTSLQYEDQTFDWVICNHVLEHIPNDAKAMSEVYRVLKEGGRAMLQVPISLELASTYQNDDITTPEERLVHYGQEDHTRVYGQDYSDKLITTGFVLRMFDPSESISKNVRRRLKINVEEKLYIVEREN